MPGGKVCSVSNCKSNEKKSKEAGENLRFFRFPRDIDIQREWIRKCQQENEWSCVNKRVCSKHFQPDDYEDAFQAKFFNIKPKKLKKDGKFQKFSSNAYHFNKSYYFSNSFGIPTAFTSGQFDVLRS